MFGSIPYRKFYIYIVTTRPIEESTQNRVPVFVTPRICLSQKLLVLHTNTKLWLPNIYTCHSNESIESAEWSRLSLVNTTIPNIDIKIYSQIRENASQLEVSHLRLCLKHVAKA
ncbi:hypothetical protein J6590_030282 [Homalodisca vitripennis]|nr:hypothetical protein J6590_030282 [Homalodisca vitripennis]